MKKLRLIDSPEADSGDLYALPSAVAESRVVSPFLLSSHVEDTVIIQSITRRGLLVGTDTHIDRNEARAQAFDVAVKPRTHKTVVELVDTVSYKDLVSKSGKKSTLADRRPDDVACILYTSGTTAAPKGVSLTHKNFLAETEMTKTRIGQTETDVVVGVLPFFHVFGLANALITAVECGAAVVPVSRYTPRNVFNAVKRSGATILLAIPTMFVHLSQFCERLGVSLPGTLRYCISGGAPFQKEQLEQAQKTLGSILIEGYGMTETTSAVSLNPEENSKPGSIGTPLAGVQMKIVDESGRDLPPGQVGEIVVRSPTVTQGYHNLERETADAIRGGFLYTGDLGFRDDDGYFFITDRKKDLIICGGENISPREIEEALLQHPKVEEAAVIGLQMGTREFIKAYVVGDGVTEDELLHFCRDRLVPIKAPKSVEFRDNLPKSLTGKVLKKELRPDYTDERMIRRKPLEDG